MAGPTQDTELSKCFRSEECLGEQTNSERFERIRKALLRAASNTRWDAVNLATMDLDDSDDWLIALWFQARAMAILLGRHVEERRLRRMREL